MPIDKRSAAVSRLSEVMLPKEAYEADLQVNARAQIFATEIVRLGLLAIGGIGFLLTAAKNGRPLGPDWLLFTSLALLGAAVGAALVHRYFSTDCIVCQIAILRLVMRLEDTKMNGSIRDSLTLSLNERRDRQERDMRFCRALTFCAALALAAGAMSLAALLGSTYAA